MTVTFKNSESTKVKYYFRAIRAKGKWTKSSSGLVWYDFDNGKYFTVKWNDPYVGSNSYTFGGTALGTGGFRIIRSGGSGDNAQVTLTLQPN